MALWKPFRGNRADLDSVSKHDGYVYFCIDDGCLFFDYIDADGKLQRKQINAQEAEELVDYDIATLLNSSDSEIPTSKAVLDALTGKSDTGHKHVTTDVTGLQDLLDAKSDVGHDHAIADVTGLQSALDGKAATSHGTHVTYSTTAPKMDGTASVGTASNVARGDHIHPTDTSRASKADLDALSDVVDGKAPITHNHTITANASDDDVVVLTGTSGTNGVTYSASHANSGVTAGTYKSVTVNAKGHVTGGSNPTTLSGYGITDAATKVSLDALAEQVAGKANTTHQHAAGDITSGTLPIARGGTGATTAENALKNLGIYIGPTEPTDTNIKIWINTAEEGTGVIPIMPRITTITLNTNAWTGNASPYKQTVTVNSVTTNTKIDLQPTATQLTSLQNDDISLMAENANGVVSIYSFGGKPSSNMSIQAMLMEVVYV